MDRRAVRLTETMLSVWLNSQGDHPVVFLVQGAALPAEAVSGLPGWAGDPAGVGEWGATSAGYQPGSQLLLQPVSLYSLHN